MLARFMAATYGITRGRVGGASSNDNNSYKSGSASPESEMDDNNSSHNDSSNNSSASADNGLDDNKSSLNKEFDDNNIGNSNQEEEECAPYRVLGVGHDNKTNEVLVSPAARDAKSNVLFFPGDVHDFRANMLGGVFNDFADFAYERVADVLASKFGSGDECNVWVVRPARFHQRAFSCFDNFVDANELGAATAYSSAGSAIKHLLALVENVRETLQQQGVSVSTDLPIHLVGFSKGVIVLNQLITELAICKREGFKSNNRREGQLADVSSYHKFFSQVCSIHWVDGGNGSQRGVVPSDERALSAVHDFSNARLFVHVTPYQYESTERPWIKLEIHEFIQKMRRFQVDVQLKMYYDGEAGSIHSHFQLLRDFEAQSTFSPLKTHSFSSPEHALPHIHIQSL
ncbi:hypothetical protein Gpo141_00007624 [Globisporangium polare]